MLEIATFVQIAAHRARRDIRFTANRRQLTGREARTVGGGLTLRPMNGHMPISRFVKGRPPGQAPSLPSTAHPGRKTPHQERLAARLMRHREERSNAAIPGRWALWLPWVASSFIRRNDDLWIETLIVRGGSSHAPLMSHVCSR